MDEADEKLTQSELGAMFGETIPWDAVELIFKPPVDAPMSVIRAKLQEMAAAHKAKQGRLEIADAILNAAVNAVCREEYGCAPETIPNVAARVREASEVALRAVIPLIEAAAFERAAQCAYELRHPDSSSESEDWVNGTWAAANAIRSLKEKTDDAR